MEGAHFDQLRVRGALYSIWNSWELIAHARNETQNLAQIDEILGKIELRLGELEKGTREIDKHLVLLRNLACEADSPQSISNLTGVAFMRVYQLTTNRSLVSNIPHCVTDNFLHVAGSLIAFFIVMFTAHYFFQFGKLCPEQLWSSDFGGSVILIIIVSVWIWGMVHWVV